MTNLDSVLKSKDITLPTEVHIVKPMVFPVVMYGCESWTLKKAECKRIDAFELWCWKRHTGMWSQVGYRKHHYKASGGNGISVELFQILNDDAVKVLYSTWQQIWKTQQWPQAWKRSIFLPIPKKGNVKECPNYCTIALISHASKLMLKILQAKLQ